MNIIQNYVLISGDCIEIVTALPAPGTMSNDAILEQFVEDLRDNTQGLSPLAKVICLNGPATGTMMAVLGAWAVRFGAKALEVFDPRQGGYVPVLGGLGPVAMPLPIQPGMRVEITRGGLLATGAEAEVINVGTDSVNVAAIGGRGRRRETAWTSLDAVVPTAWERLPRF